MKSRSPLPWACLLLILWLPHLSGRTFKDEQLLYPRVRAAYRDKEAGLRALCGRQGLSYPPPAILIRIFKREQELEVWAPTAQGPWVLLKQYPVCAVSGRLGPKRVEGDMQVPEGFYRVNLFNPESRFHLSLQIDYPNASDRILSRGRRLGGLIFIHGSCVTIGCVPIRDENIKEVYLLAVEAAASGQSRIPVHIFPARLTPPTMAWLKKEHVGNKEMAAFWDNLVAGYVFFEREHRPPLVSVDQKGRYRFQ